MLEKLKDIVQEVKLSDISFPTVDENFLNKRDELIASDDLGHPVFNLARQFAAADVIVVAAPYYDMSFRASLKQYLEQVNVVGITFRYSPDGIPVSLCNAKKLYYITTAGGNYVPEEFGFGYVKALAEGYYGIMRVDGNRIQEPFVERAEKGKAVVVNHANSEYTCIHNQRVA